MGGAREAVLGLKKKPVFRASKIFEEYEQETNDQVLDLSPDQLRIWRNARKRVVKSFADVVDFSASQRIRISLCDILRLRVEYHRAGCSACLQLVADLYSEMVISGQYHPVTCDRFGRWFQGSLDPINTVDRCASRFSPDLAEAEVVDAESWEAVGMGDGDFGGEGVGIDAARGHVAPAAVWIHLAALT